MSGPSLGTILKAALLAGLAAGLTVAIFHALATEPVIDRAIELEAAHHDQQAAAEPPPVSREVQRGGLFVGFVLYGLTWATLFGLAYHLIQQRGATGGDRRQRLLVALGAYWAVGLLPFLKYPASPPGVGDPATIGYRQVLYLAFLALSVAATVLAVLLGRRLAGGRAGGPQVWPPTLALLVGFGLLLYLALPGNPDPVEMPTELVNSFRLLSLAGLTLFWVVLGGFFTLLLRTEPAARASAH